eukprot:7470903-Pyramimonas_sp.AAC.1
MPRSKLAWLACLRLQTACALRGMSESSLARVSSTIADPECKGRKPQWTQDGPVKRLKGPVFNIHIP